MNIIVVILTPFLIYDDNEYQDHHHLNIKELDMLIDQRISADKTNIKDIFNYGDYKSTDYYYDGENVYVTVKRIDNKPITDHDKEYIKNDIVNPYDVGPDTWMEGNIYILNGNDFKKYDDTLYQKYPYLSLIHI